MLTRINLLPQEYRKKEMTPMGVFLPVVAAMALVVASGFFWGWLHFAALARTEGERNSLQDVYASKQPTLTYLANLRNEESVYKQRTDTILEIASSRTLWCKKVDQLCDVLTDDDGGDRYLFRADELSVKEPMRRTARRGSKGPAEGETVTLKGYCFNDEDPLYDFNVLREAIMRSAFYMSDFLSISRPEGQVERPDADLRPTKAWTVDLNMVMHGKTPQTSKGTALKAGSK